jgi:hypothetical protein
MQRNRLQRNKLLSIILIGLGVLTFFTVLIKEPSSALYKFGFIAALVFAWAGMFFLDAKNMIGIHLKGSLYILFGIILIFLAASELIVRGLVVFFGLYLIYTGLKLRNDQRILFFFHRFRNRF